MYDNLCGYIHDELTELDRKTKSGGKLSAQEIEYGDTLAHMKKSLLTSEAMEGTDDGYSGAGYNRMPEPYRYARGGYAAEGGAYYGGAYNGVGYRGTSRARGRGVNADRDAMGRYSGDGDSVEQMRRMAADMPNDQLRQEMMSLLNRAQQQM